MRARVCARTHVCVALVKDIVNWLRLTFSRGIVKGTVPPRLCRKPFAEHGTFSFYIKYYFEVALSQENPWQKEIWLRLRLKSNSVHQISKHFLEKHKEITKTYAYAWMEKMWYVCVSVCVCCLKTWMKLIQFLTLGISMPIREENEIKYNVTEIDRHRCWGRERKQGE